MIFLIYPSISKGHYFQQKTEPTRGGGHQKLIGVEIEWVGWSRGTQSGFTVCGGSRDERREAHSRRFGPVRSPRYACLTRGLSRNSAPEPSSTILPVSRSNA